MYSTSGKVIESPAASCSTAPTTRSSSGLAHTKENHDMDLSAEQALAMPTRPDGPHGHTERSQFRVEVV